MCTTSDCFSGRQLVLFLLIAFMLLSSAGSAAAQTSAFTYQGRLTDGGTPANGNYDLQFALWDSLSGGAQIGATQTNSTVTVSSGIFSATLDFGANAFPGANRFLEISARLSGASSFSLLTPRQQITSTPYAVRSSNATLADTATNATQLGGSGASQYVQISDSRLTDARAPSAGSSNYIQNSAQPQSSSNFNISGDGTAGGSLTGNIVKAMVQYNIGGARFLSNAGTNNTFVGVNAGQNNAGSSNTFVGTGAGLTNTTGPGNAFFGAQAGQANTTGSSNSFVGFNAGLVNTTGGNNSFFGQNAGAANTAGLHNSFFGDSAGAANTASFNAFFGDSAGLSNTIGTANAYFGRGAGLANTTGSDNSFFGFDAGLANNGGQNSFFGRSAGAANTASNNSFFGYNAGLANTTGGNDSFFGNLAGRSNTVGFDNSFFGSSAGLSNTTGFGNSFFGSFAGNLSSTGSKNAFFGDNDGLTDTTGSQNSFFGESAGLDNTSGSLNTFIGNNAGGAHQTGDNNIAIGANASVSNGIANAAAIGANSSVTVSNRIVLGTNTNQILIPGQTIILGGLTADSGMFIVGDVSILGNLTKSGGSFKIDYPLNPTRKYLYHSFVESPDMMNIYNGIATLDKRGVAVVRLPEYFEALNRDFRYQLTAVGAPGPSLYIAAEIKGNQFKIAGGKPGRKVSWQVTGIRHDPYANANRIKPVVDKPGRELGTYLHPELYSQPIQGNVRLAPSKGKVQKAKRLSGR